MVFEQKFGFSLVVSCSQAAISLWFLQFFRLFGSNFFLNGFPNAFTVHSRSSFFVWAKFPFLNIGFCSHAAFWHWFFGLYLFFIWIFRNGFPNSIVIRSWSSFLFSQWKFFEFTLGLVLLCIFISSSWFLLRPYDVTATFCSFFHAISTELHVWRHFFSLILR